MYKFRYDTCVALTEDVRIRCFTLYRGHHGFVVGYYGRGYYKVVFPEGTFVIFRDHLELVRGVQNA